MKNSKCDFSDDATMAQTHATYVDDEHDDNHDYDDNTDDDNDFDQVRSNQIKSD